MTATSYWLIYSVKSTFCQKPVGLYILHLLRFGGVRHVYGTLLTYYTMLVQLLHYFSMYYTGLPYPTALMAVSGRW